MTQSSLQQKNNTKVGVGIKFVFFGTSRFSVIILDELKSRGLLPSLIVTTEDKPKGRKLVLTPPEVKIWAEQNKIPYIQPKKLDNEVYLKLSTFNFQLFIVASYGKIIPEKILQIPKYKTLNVHPSLLPKLRGASPLQSAILGEKETGVSIMRLDKEMDHGPIVFQQKIAIMGWPPYESDLESILGQSGGKILANILPKWVNGEIEEIEQDHSKATFCKKIQKTDGLLNLNDSAEINLRKIKAYHIWPTAYFFDESGKRIIVKKAHIEKDELLIERVIPEGKKEMEFKDYLNGNPSSRAKLTTGQEK